MCNVSASIRDWVKSVDLSLLPAYSSEGTVDVLCLIEVPLSLIVVY